VLGIYSRNIGRDDLSVLFVMTEIVLPIMARPDMRCTWILFVSYFLCCTTFGLGFKKTEGKKRSLKLRVLFL